MLDYKPIYDKEYQEHTIFKKLDEIIEFYDMLSFSIMQYFTYGIKGLGNIDTYLFSSIEGTITSIKLLLKDGRINDAYALLRKYNDGIIINIYINLYIDNNKNLENIIVEKINNWIEGKEKIPDYKVMANYIIKYEKLKELNSIIDISKYINIREKCNDNIHYNFFHCVILNDNEINNPNRIKELNKFLENIEDFFLFHISYLFYFSDHYMASSNYFDSLELGIKPPEGSEKWVSPLMQDFFDKIIKNKRPDIAKLIKNKSSMDLR